MQSAWMLLNLAVLMMCALASATAGDVSYPIRVSANHRHLVDQNDAPFLYHADTGWHLFEKLTRAEVEAYLENRRAKGFNTVQVQLLAETCEDHTNAIGAAALSATIQLGGVRRARRRNERVQFRPTR